MCKFFGRVQENHTITFKQKTEMPYNYSSPAIIEKIEKFGKSFKKLTVDTVKGFLSDTKKSKFKI